MSRLIKKIIPLVLFLAILAGLFGGTIKTQAQGVRIPPTPRSTATTTPATPAPTTTSAIATPSSSTTGLTASDKNGLYQNLTCFSGVSINIGECLGILFYFIFVTIPSWLLILAGMFFNALIAIGLQSELFGAGFVSQAWTVVRDFSNIFFILILLYVAIQTILGMGHETKKVIVHVVIMALLINFSMFFAKVVIDTSNTLALVFYNRISGGTSLPETNIPGQKDVSSRLAGAFNPSKFLSQEFFLKARQKTNVLPVSVGQAVLKTVVLGPLYAAGELVGFLSPSYSLPIELTLGIELVSGLIMAFAAYTFFTVGFLFLARLIELWILIIFAPFAFMSFSLPKLAGISYIGWDKWVHRLISLSFMAPIFMFFLYLIFMIINAGLFVSFERDPANQTTTEAILFVIIPAIVILILLLKATKYAKDASGELGAAAIGGAKLIAGLAVGGTALGTAAVGRVAVGRVMASASKQAGAVEHGEYLFKMEKWKKAGRIPGQRPALVAPPATLFGKLGAQINKSQFKSGEISHARHEMDELKKKVHLEGLDDRQISGVDKKLMEKEFVKDKKSEIETDIKRGKNAKDEPVLLTTADTQNGITARGEGDYKDKRRDAMTTNVRNTGVPQDLDPTAVGGLSDQGKKKVEDRLNQEFNEILNRAATRIGKEKYEHFQKEAKENIGLIDTIRAKSTSGSYDIRNLPDMKTDRREGIGLKATAGIVAAVALGMRAGINKVAEVNYGTPQRNVMKDIGDVVKESLKSVKINVDLKGGGDSHGGDKHATSGGGHH